MKRRKRAPREAEETIKSPMYGFNPRKAGVAYELEYILRKVLVRILKKLLVEKYVKHATRIGRDRSKPSVRSLFRQELLDLELAKTLNVMVEEDVIRLKKSYSWVDLAWCRLGGQTLFKPQDRFQCKGVIAFLAPRDHGEPAVLNLAEVARRLSVFQRRLRAREKLSFSEELKYMSLCLAQYSRRPIVRTRERRIYFETSVFSLNLLEEGLLSETIIQQANFGVRIRSDDDFTLKSIMASDQLLEIYQQNEIDLPEGSLAEVAIPRVSSTLSDASAQTEGTDEEEGEDETQQDLKASDPTYEPPDELKGEGSRGLDDSGSPEF